MSNNIEAVKGGEQVVHVFNSSPKTLADDIGRVLDASEFSLLNPGKRTYIKVNANYARRWPGCNTSTWFMSSLLKELRRRGFSDLTAIEGDLKLQPAAQTLMATGLGDVLAAYDVPFLNTETLERDSTELPKALSEVQLISTPVLHTHTFAVVSCAAKNLYGLLPIYREKYHVVLSEKLLELVANTRVFSIVDGTVGLEGGSMRLGTRRRTDIILAGWNPLAVDVVAARLMGFAVPQVPHLVLAERKGVLPAVVVRGDYDRVSLPTYNFSWRRSPLAEFDLWLRGNRLTRGLFRYNSLADRFANRARQIYTHYLYERRKGAVLEGDWTEYARINAEPDRR